MTYAEWRRHYGKGVEISEYGEKVSKTRSAYYAGLEEGHDLLLSFVASLTLADNLGDVGNAIQTVLERAGVHGGGDNLSEIQVMLRTLGVVTLHGTELPYGDDDEDT